MLPGTAVLGLGDIGPEASLPVMEGKALLFKEFAGVDAFPVCLDVTDSYEIIETVKKLAPSFGGINLEDIAAPAAFEVEEALQEALDIPVFHDDQHGTAIISTAALLNALDLSGKKISDAKIVVNGDPTQIDLPNKNMSGLVRSKELLGHLNEIAVVDFDHSDVVRHPLVSKIVKAYSKND